MPLQKIVKFKGQFFFQCLHSGVLIKHCYAYPDFDRYKRRKNGGSFADSACAVAYLETQLKNGKISIKKHANLMESIRMELIPHRPDLELIEAPNMTPDRPYFEYRKDYPYMYDESLFLDVQTVLQWRKDDKEHRQNTRKERGPYIYQTVKGTIYPLDKEQFPLRQDCIIHPFEGGVLLEDMDSQIHRDCGEFIDKLTDIQNINRDSLIILSKKPKEERDPNVTKGKGKNSKIPCLGGGGKRKRGERDVGSPGDDSDSGE